MSDLLERIAVVKAKWSMPELVEQLLGEPVPTNRKVHSPFNAADSSPSCHIYDDSFYCYSTGKYGDVVDLVREIKHCTVERAVQILEEEADELGLVQTVRTVAPRPVFVLPKLGWWTGLPSVLLDGPSPFPNLAGVSKNVLGDLAFRGRIALHYADLAILHFKPGTPIATGVKYRHGDGKKTSEPGSDFSSYLYQPFDYRFGPTSIYGHACVITEGETDSWAWLSVRPDDHVFALPAGVATWKDAYLKQLEPYEHVWLAFDNDEAGNRGADKVSLAVGYGRANRVNIPSLYKDVRAAVAAGWVPTL